MADETKNQDDKPAGEQASPATANQVETPPGQGGSASPTPKAQGAYRIFSLKQDGTFFWTPEEKERGEEPSNDPSLPGAREIYFGVRADVDAVPNNQMELQDQIGQALTTIQKLYIDDAGEEKPQFRTYYVRLFRLAQLGLEFDALPDAANTALDRTINDLIRAEGSRVKTQHLLKLGKAALLFAAAFTLLYFVAAFAILREPLAFFGIDWENARCFMILWAGTAIGVWLSYAMRKRELTLRDLTTVDDGLLEPNIRLLFTGWLATFIGLILMLGIVDFELGGFSLSSFATNPTVALFLGMLLGINEALLPDAVLKQVQNLWEKIA